MCWGLTRQQHSCNNPFCQILCVLGALPANNTLGMIYKVFSNLCVLLGVFPANSILVVINYVELLCVLGALPAHKVIGNLRGCIVFVVAG